MLAAYHGLRSGVDEGLRRFIGGVYEPLLRRALRAPVAVVALMMAFLIGSFGLVAAGLVPFVVFPDFDSNYITASDHLPRRHPGRGDRRGDPPDRRGDRPAARRDRRRRRVGPRCGPIARSLGYAETAGGGGPGASASRPGSNIGQVFVEMVGGEERPISSFELVNRWREASLKRVSGFDELKFAAGNSGPGGKPIEFQLVGKDMDALEADGRSLQGAPGDV